MHAIQRMIRIDIAFVDKDAVDSDEMSSMPC